ncbi:hypothetical protein [Sphingobium subterraneum]|uniref:Protein TonB n=1 Tax=Sphingobium subterraneum TaxID=627688 RepID=A0A841J350_9SPHN|nr:hypothetical protein [Sphingobium subterraneum]MBB6125110.1 protein TonB [Sphingobium subterraneum]
MAFPPVDAYGISMQFIVPRWVGMPHDPRARQRAVAFLLALAVHALVLALFLWVKSAPPPVKEERAPTSFTLLPEPAQEKQQAKTQPERKASRAAEAKPTPAPVTPKPPEEPPALIPMAKDVYAAGDISKLPSRGQSAGVDNGIDSAGLIGPGDGPGGVRLFNAEWVRRPTDAELAGYMPPNAPRTGWGLVACKTIANNRVENCQALGESPMGSGFARAVREAAWQFLVLPPRINGRPVVGAWVRIRIDYTATERKG